jgi:hypothetical protein
MAWYEDVLVAVEGPAIRSLVDQFRTKPFEDVSGAFRSGKETGATWILRPVSFPMGSQAASKDIGGCRSVSYAYG